MERKNLSKINLEGKVVGMLKVINRVPETKSLWNCECKCGNKIQLHASRIIDPKRKSCGCILRENHRKFGEKNITHGMTNTKLYKTYRSMLDRCYNSKIKNYKDYGGRGIKVCDEWVQSFENFQKWAMNNGYSESKDRLSQSLDRIDVNGDYEPSNCRWANPKTQTMNKRNTYKAYYNGEEWTLSTICEMCGITDKSFAYRRFKKGQSIEGIIKDWNEKEIIPEYLIECSEYALEIGVCSASVRRMINQGKIKGEKRGRKWYVVKNGGK